MRQLLVECSDPGMVVVLEEELEHVLRNVNFQRARELQAQLTKLAGELGGDYAQAWSGFHMEVANDGNDVPPSFGSRNPVDKQSIKELLSRAADEGIGKFSMRPTLLLPQDGPAPETREQYICDLADSIRYTTLFGSEWGERPFAFPRAMEQYRYQLLEEHVLTSIRRSAHNPRLGRKWVQEIVKCLEESITEADLRAVAVMEYELSKMDPDSLGIEEKTQWTVLACNVGKAIEKWYTACEKELEYVYQRAALLAEMWHSCQGFGPAAPFIREQFQGLLQEAASVYTDDGVQALERVYEQLQHLPWNLLRGLLDQEERDAGDDDTQATRE